MWVLVACRVGKAFSCHGCNPSWLLQGTAESGMRITVLTSRANVRGIRGVCGSERFPLREREGPGAILKGAESERH